MCFLVPRGRKIDGHLEFSTLFSRTPNLWCIFEPFFDMGHKKTLGRSMRNLFLNKKTKKKHRGHRAQKKSARRNFFYAFLSGGKNNKEVLKLLEEINKNLPGIMGLDLEACYSRGLFVSKRGVKGGAKKKYALLDSSGKIKIRGFETIRRDWCGLTRNLQSKILTNILKEGNEKKSLKLVKNVISKLKNREIDLDDLIIRTQIKRPLEEYLSEGPHVVAAKKMEKQGISVSPGMLVSYFVGEINGKGKRVGDRVFLPNEKSKYDIDYYLNNQILPAIENIFDVFGIDIHEVVDGEKQEKLF